MHLVHRGAAYPIVRLVLKQVFPCLPYQVGGILHPQCIGQRCERFHKLFQKDLVSMILLLQIHSGGENSGENGCSSAISQLACESIQQVFDLSYLVHEYLKIAVNQRIFRMLSLIFFHVLGQFLLRKKVVLTVHQEYVFRCCIWFEPFRLFLHLSLERFHTLESYVICVEISIGKIHRYNLAAILRFPYKLAFSALIHAVASPENKVIYIEATQNLGHLLYMPEGVRQVPYSHNSPKSFRDFLTEHQVSYERFSADKKFIGKYVPGSNENASLPYISPELLFLLGPYLQIILKHYGLTIQSEVSEILPRGEYIEKSVYHPHKPCTEDLVWQIPLSVPVGMGHHVNFPPTHG